jgi:RNA polymerase sigma-70 factor (ECF subfamily)
MTDGSRNASSDEWLHQVLQRHEQPLIGHALRLLGDADAARDVAQDTFLELCRRPIALEDARLGPWLHRVCRNRAIDRLRKERRMHRLDDPSAAAEPAAASSPALAVQRQEEGARLHGLVQQLPPRQQEVVWLRFRSGLSYREIAEVCSTSTGNVGFLLHEALRRLRARLGEVDSATATGGES